MKVEQISVFIENKSGRLADVTRTLDSSGVNIRALSLADTSDFGVLRLIVDNKERAREALRDGGFTVSKTEVVAVEVPDRPGALSAILQMLDEALINIEYLYAFVERNISNAVIIFRFDNVENAIALLRGKGVNILTEQHLAEL